MMLRTLKRSWLWSLAISLLMAAQIALALHSVHHEFSSDIDTSSDACAICQVASAMSAAPDAVSIEPASYFVTRAAVPAPPPIYSAAITAAFQARAPPV